MWQIYVLHLDFNEPNLKTLIKGTLKFEHSLHPELQSRKFQNKILKYNLKRIYVDFTEKKPVLLGIQ